jgi:hypothetical protein
MFVIENRSIFGRFAMLALLYSANSPSTVTAATLRFDARITSTPAGIPFDLPLAFQVGDVIHGHVTFEPGPGTPIADRARESIQEVGYTFDINGDVVTSSWYRLQVFDDTAYEDSDWGIVDTTTLQSLFPPDPQPQVIALPGQGDPFRVRVLISLVGESNSLPELAITADAAVWNSLTLERVLNLNFNNPLGGAMGLRAEIGSFIPIPEPRALGLGCLVAITFLVAKRNLS